MAFFMTEKKLTRREQYDQNTIVQLITSETGNTLRMKDVTFAVTRQRRERVEPKVSACAIVRVIVVLSPISINYACCVLFRLICLSLISLAIMVRARVLRNFSLTHLVVFFLYIICSLIDCSPPLFRSGLYLPGMQETRCTMCTIKKQPT